MAVHDYAAELTLGRGRVIVSTLRFAGGLGDQPGGAVPAWLLGAVTGGRSNRVVEEVDW